IHHETSSSPVSPLAAVFHSRSCSRCATLAFRSPLPPRFFLHGPILPPPARPFAPTPTAAPRFMVHALATRLATISLIPIPASPSVTHVVVIIVGAGFSGLCMGIKLLEAGMNSFLIIEKSADIGGTWWENRYPGCACDIPSHLYSFSFAPSTEWTRMYPGQQEIHAYLKRFVEHYVLPPHLYLNTPFQQTVCD